MTTRTPPVWLLVTGACTGVALALPLVTLAETWHVLVAVITAVLLATVLTGPGRPAEPERQRTVAAPVTRTGPARPAPPAAATATARLVLDVDQPAGGGGQWWNRTSAAPRSTSNGKTPLTAAPARDLSGYVENARVVQCPRCGSFQIDVTRLAGGYSLRCRTDEHAWQWRPGRAWPAAVVLSRRRTP